MVGAKFSDVRIRRVVAGKLRRYRGSRISLKEGFLNLRDLLLVVVGFFQSLGRLVVWRPDVIFLKGGYVGLPVGLAAAVLGIPFAVHDSDAVLGLTNRILGRFAKKIAVSWPVENYTGKFVQKMVFTGVPVSDDVVKYQHAAPEKLKKQLGFDGKKPLLVAVGGGLGAKSINLALVQNLGDLLGKYAVVLVAGRAQYADVQKKTAKYAGSPDFRLFDFLTDGLGELLAAADVVVARAGATTIAELAVLQKAAILVPAEFLTGGHQSKNAAILEQAKAAVVIRDADLKRKLVGGVDKIMESAALKRELENNIRRFKNERAAADLARLIMDVA